jgi:hypothetical protein
VEWTLRDLPSSNMFVELTLLHSNSVVVLRHNVLHLEAFTDIKKDWQGLMDGEGLAAFRRWALGGTDALITHCQSVRRADIRAIHHPHGEIQELIFIW